MRQEIRAMRNACVKHGVVALQVKERAWVLVKLITTSTGHVEKSPSGWLFRFPAFHKPVTACTAERYRAIRATGHGRGKRPYPTRELMTQVLFPSEKLAYLNYLIKGETFKWH